jgi:hypothetical protein
MAITANMTTHDGIALTDAYIRVTSTYVKKITVEYMDPETEENHKSDVWKLIYNVLIYKDKATRDDEVKEKSMRISNRHIDHFKIDYDLDSSDNPVKLAYADLKTNSELSNVQDV